MTVNGTGFTSDLNLAVLDPTGAKVVLGVQTVLPTSLVAVITFDKVGTYAISLQKASGPVSEAFGVFVAPSGSVSPVIASITPGSTLRSSQSQTVTLNGANFTHTQTVQVTDPTGQTTLLTNGQFTIAADALINVNIILNRAGTFVFVVTDDTGAMSNPMTLTVV